MADRLTEDFVHSPDEQIRLAADLHLFLTRESERIIDVYGREMLERWWRLPSPEVFNPPTPVAPKRRRRRMF